MSRRELAVDPFGWHALWASEDVVPTTVSLSGTVRSTNISHTEWITVPDPVSGFVECGHRVIHRAGGRTRSEHMRHGRRDGSR
jgi:hypothetical protein